ncbi:NACHT, LRR and PYD domains-containing protein 12-like [Embiotoca jacksoni]|uniref:NACHT, LRR and PYD domains-containing protein 12-like n=1 Tax=Embiotoca jacksoni TaxID=100190 RepID=UPI0037044D7E
MDLQACLQTALRKKYRTLFEAYPENSLLPPRLCYRDFKEDQRLSNLNQNELRFVDKSGFPLQFVYTRVTPAEIFSCDCLHNTSKRTVITVGASGVGKTVTVQSCALNWADRRDHHDIRFLFPLAFWEFNLLKQKLSLIELLQTFFPELKELDASSLNKENVWFILDGLDEYRRPLNFSCPAVINVSEACTVDSLVTNLIRGNLLPHAHIWLLTRYSAAAKIPNCYFLKETELQGFSNEQKEQYFGTVLGNEDLANKAIDHVRLSRSLDFLCQIPSICTIVAHVFKDHLKVIEGYKIHPLNLTQIYTNLLKASNSNVIAKLKRLALVRKNEDTLIFESDLLERDISAEAASAFAKECPLVLREETGLHNHTVFRFGQWSILEFLAASAKLDDLKVSRVSLRCTCKRLVDEALKSNDGEFDTFLRFLFGLIKERHLLDSNDVLFVYTKRTIMENVLSDSFFGLFQCLREYDSQALQSEAKFFAKFDVCPMGEFSQMQWEFMVNKIMDFDGIQDKFEMPVPMRCEEKLLRQLPDILRSRKAILRFSNLTDKSCPALAAVMSTKESHLRELDLGYNSFSDSGVFNLVQGLSDQNCRLKVLRLSGCGVTEQACKHLATALGSAPKLEELDISRNEVGDMGIWHLAVGLKTAECHLEKLKLSQCNIETDGCVYLAMSLHKNPTYLKELDLSINIIGDQGANELFKMFDISHLAKLEMYHCGLTVLSCIGIGEALKSETGSLVELNLSNNNLKDAGFAIICEGMYAWCRLEKLNVSGCGITGKGCIYLAKVLCSISQLFSGWAKQSEWQAVELRDLDLSMNCLRDQGVREISAGLKNPFSHLETLNLSRCSITDDCCAELAVGLASKESVIVELDLSGNDLRDKGVKKLCLGLKNPQCKLKKLSLRSCSLTSKSIQFLTSALKANPCHLMELQLMGNKLEDSEVMTLVALTKNLKYSLRTIDVSVD